MSVPDHFFRSEESENKNQLKKFLAGIILIAIAGFLIFSYLEQKRTLKLEEQKNVSNLSAEEKQVILEEIASKAPTTTIPVSEKKKILEEISKNTTTSKPQPTEEEKRKILNSMYDQ